MHPVNMLLLLLLAIIFITLWRQLKAAIEPWKKYIECGSLAPPPTSYAHHLMQVIAHWMVKWQVGEIVWHGKENLNLDCGPTLVVGNHGSSADPAVVTLMLDNPARYMAAQGCFSFGGGLGSMIFAPMGAFSADLTRGKGGPAAERMVDVLCDGQIGVMFPEGWAWMDGHLENFKKGAVRIVKMTAKRLGKTVWMQPFYIRYGHYPTLRIRHFPPPLQYLWVFLNGWYYRGVCHVVIGHRIPSNALPEDDDQATEFVRQRIAELDPATYPWYKSED